MTLIYVTGISGAGKSTVPTELIRRGYEAYGTDEDSIAAFYHNETGVRIGNDVAPDIRTEQWRKEHSWKVPRKVIKDLNDAAKGKPVFLCGVVSNDADFWELFAHVIALTVDEDTLIKRLRGRTNNDFGKSDHELRDVLAWQKNAADDYKRLGAELIDSTRPVAEVVDDIIAVSGV
jgi:thymidylate kinase